MLAILLALSATLLGPGTPRWGHEPYETAGPLDVAVSPVDGTIYVADTAAGRVVALQPDFQPMDWTLPAANVTGVDVRDDGWVAVVTGGPQGELIALDAERDEQWRIGGGEIAPFSDAWGVAWGPAGTLFVFDAGAGRVEVLDDHGEPLFTFGEYTWTRRYRSASQNRTIEEEVEDRLYRPCRGDFLPDGRLIIADYDGPILNPELERRGGRYSVWNIDLAAHAATFERFLPPDPFTDFKAGDVCVDERTGRIYTAEADFPLTDHDFVRVRDSVDETPRFGTNFFPYRFLTHPRGVALHRDGDVLVAEADKGQVFAIPRHLFATTRDAPNPLDWPKKLRIPVCERNRVVLEYTTRAPALSRVELAPVADDWYDDPDPPAEAGRRVIEVPAFSRNGREREAGQPDVFHRVELTDLEPGQRYACRFLVHEQAYPGPLWSQTFLIATAPPRGKAQYLDAEVIVLVFSNLVKPPQVANVAPEPADPGPLTPDELDELMRRLELARRFYWINSRGTFNLRYKVVIDDTRHEGGPVRDWGYWPHDDHRRIDAILAEHGVEHADCAGLVCIYGYREWNERKRQWVLSGSGGNTWGSCHDGSAILTINAGGDTTWLLTHEYGHAMSINYQYSGQVFHFNHFHWNFLPTDYGAHYDGMAAMCREFSNAAYWTNKYGRLVVVDDTDGDGLADEDPRVPLDEKRFGSLPTEVDSDEDGLTDLEELLATHGLARYEYAFGMRQVEPVYEPDPRNPDTDGDGVRDGEDRYPLYPWAPEVYQADVTVDGQFDAAEWPGRGFSRRMTDTELAGDVRLAWDPNYLYIGLLQKVRPDDGGKPARLYIEIDANNDGMTVGADNIEMRVEPRERGRVDIQTRFNDTILRLQPTWTDNVLPNPRDIRAEWGAHGTEYQLEIAIPRTKDAGLDLARFEEIGLLFQLRPANLERELRLFEPQSHFDVQLR